MPKSVQVKLWFSLKVLVLVSNCETFGTMEMVAFCETSISPCNGSIPRKQPLRWAKPQTSTLVPRPKLSIASSDRESCISSADCKSYLDSYGESCSSFMDRLMHIAGHDWETNWCNRRELCNAFMNAVSDQLHWKLSGHFDTDLLDLATLADNILLVSKNRRNQHPNHTSNFSSSAFTSTHSQSPPNVSKQPLTALQAQMHKM